jgi:hypothetical protein
MDASNTLITGIAPDHIPALVAALLSPVAACAYLRLLRSLAADGSAWAAGVIHRYDAAPFAARVTAALLFTAAAVHFALPRGHDGAPVLTLLFLASGAAYAMLALSFFTDRPWRGRAALLLLANIVAYLVLAGSGWQEEPDQVGIATKLVELMALGLITIPRLAPATEIRRRLKRPTASFAFVSLTLTTGLVIWVGAFVAHQHADATAAHDHEPGTAPHEHGHTHIFMARAQAGTIVRAGAGDPPTLEQVEAAARFAGATKAGIARYEDPQAAMADGYRPEGPMIGMERHYKNKAYEKDGRVLDPERPELLVYASKGERNVLLGAAYLMPKASTPGPQIGGSLTRWHAHNICVTLLPPAFGLVSLSAPARLLQSQLRCRR